MSLWRADIVCPQADEDCLDLRIGHDGLGLAQGVLPFLAAAIGCNNVCRVKPEQAGNRPDLVGCYITPVGAGGAKLLLRAFISVGIATHFRSVDTQGQTVAHDPKFTVGREFGLICPDLRHGEGCQNDRRQT
jgi:hypothetical protein